MVRKTAEDSNPTRAMDELEEKVQEHYEKIGYLYVKAAIYSDDDQLLIDIGYRPVQGEDRVVFTRHVSRTIRGFIKKKYSFSVDLP